MDQTKETTNHSIVSKKVPPVTEISDDEMVLTITHISSFFEQ